MLEMLCGNQSKLKDWLKKDQIRFENLQSMNRCSIVSEALWQNTHVYVAFWRLYLFFEEICKGK